MVYILSQVFVCLTYLLMGTSYLSKNRTIILCLSLGALLTNGVHYILLGAWTGLGVVCIAILRNILFLIQSKIKALDKTVIDDWIILTILMVVSGVVAYFTYDTFMSLFSVFASIIYMLSLWQKNVNAYRILGVVSSALNIIYMIYINSIFGIILESTVFVISVITSIKGIIKTQNSSKIPENQWKIAQILKILIWRGYE